MAAFVGKSPRRRLERIKKTELMKNGVKKINVDDRDHFNQSSRKCLG